MQTHDPDPAGDLLAKAVAGALADARWEQLDLLGRRPPTLIPDLLTARADELAASPRARDQLLAIALERVAQGHTVGAGAEALLGPTPAEGDRLALRRLAATEDVPVHAARAFVDALEARHRGSGPHEPAPAHALAVEANLNELLWDDPRIRADADVRLIMMCSVMKLRDRVDHLRALPMRMTEAAARLPLIGSFLRGRS